MYGELVGCTVLIWTVGTSFLIYFSRLVWHKVPILIGLATIHAETKKKRKKKQTDFETNC